MEYYDFFMAKKLNCYNTIYELEYIQSNTLCVAFLASRNMHVNQWQSERHLLPLSTNHSKKKDLSKGHALSSFQRMLCFHLDRLKIKDFVCK